MIVDAIRLFVFMLLVTWCSAVWLPHIVSAIVGP
jgi:hypothetical protein